MGDNAFYLHSATQAYNGAEVLSIDELAIEAEGIFCVLGPSGSGKSTFLRLLNLVEKPKTGWMEFFGQRIDYGRETLDKRRQMAMVFQDPLLFNTSVKNNLAYGLNVRRMSRDTIRDYVLEAARLVGVEHLLGKHAKEISGGEAQRVALARAFAVKPKALLLDEPFASLDAPSKVRLRQEVHDLVKKSGITTVIVTHDQDEAMAMADTIAVLDHGRIQQIGSPQDLYLRADNAFVAGFFGVENIYSGYVKKSEQGLATIELGGETAEVVGDFSVGDKVELFLRAEDIAIEADVERSGSARNHWLGKVSKVLINGAIARIEVQSRLTTHVVITRRSMEDLEIKKGKKVILAFKATAIHAVRK